MHQPLGKVRLSGDEIEALKAFLHTLEDRGPANIENIIPASVPSGLPVRTLRNDNAKAP